MNILKKLKAADNTWIYVIKDSLGLFLIRRNCQTWDTFESLEEALKNAHRLKFIINERQCLFTGIKCPQN